MRLRDPPPFGYDVENDRPILRLEDDAALDGIELRAFGSEYDDTNTMFAIFAGDERLLTRFIEPKLVEFVGRIADAEAFTMEVEGHNPRRVDLDDDQIQQLAEVHYELELGLEDAPRT